MAPGETKEQQEGAGTPESIMKRSVRAKEQEPSLIYKCIWSRKKSERERSEKSGKDGKRKETQEIILKKQNNTVDPKLFLQDSSVFVTAKQNPNKTTHECRDGLKMTHGVGVGLSGRANA